MSFVVAIDGPAGSGKGTVTKIVASKKNLQYIDTGAMYRCIALKMLEENVGLEDTEKIKKILDNIQIDLEGSNVFLNNRDVTKQIRTVEVSNFTSPVSAIVFVREKMVELQRALANGKDVIMEGRDIGTIVFPNADVKIYLDDDAIRPYLLYRPDTSSKQVDFSIASKYASWQDVISNSTTRKDVTTNNLYFFPYFDMEGQGYSNNPPFYSMSHVSSNWSTGGILYESYTDSKNRKIYHITGNAGVLFSPFDTVELKYDNYTKSNYLPAKYDTNIPMFTEGDIDNIVKWVYDGDRSGELKLPSPPAIFGLWIDGLKKPIYKLNWHIDELEDNNYDFDDVVVEIKAGVRDSTGIFHKTLLTVPYNDGSVNFSWYDFENLGLKTSILNPNG